MMHDISTATKNKSNHENELNAIMSKIHNTQNVIRNKFEKACKNRLEHERETDCAMQPLVASISPSSDLDYNEIVSSSHNLPKTDALKEWVHQPRLHAKMRSNHAVVKSRMARKNDHEEIDTNKLCNRLRLLLSSPFAGLHYDREINTIIAKLCEHEILL